MPPVLTANATITCAHAGRVTLTPSQSVLLVDGAPALCEGDLVGSPILGCLQPPTLVTKPCTAVVSAASVTPGKVVVAGRPVSTAPQMGLTDGVPPAPLLVVSPGQTRLLA